MPAEAIELEAARSEPPLCVREHLEQRIVCEGRVVDELPDWLAERIAWNGAALLLGDDAVLLLRPQPQLEESDSPRWSATRAFGR
jgi:hypothetical protein